MTVVKKIETDMFRFASLCDIMVNPVNTIGAMGKGLAKEFRERHPGVYTVYKKACEDGSLKIGKIQVIKDPKVRYKIVNLPTKEDWRDASRVEYIVEGLKALRRYLDRPENRYATVGMPMLGCGAGLLGYQAVEKYFYEYLDDLDAVVLLSQNPEYVETIPKYLGIVGPRVFADPFLPKSTTPNPHYKEQLSYVFDNVNKSLTEWGLTPADFDAVVSGGATGVDRAAIGTSYDDPYLAESYASKFLPDKHPIICFADWDKFGLSAGMKRNFLIEDIATHIVAFHPPGVVSVGTVEMIKHIRRQQVKYGVDNANYTRLSVIGEDITFEKPSLSTRL